MKKVLFGTARGAIGQANINSKELKAFKVPVPPLDMQHRFQRHCEDVIAMSAMQVVSTAKAEATFAAFLGRAFASNALQGAV